MTKKLLACLFSVLTLGALASCGGDEPAEPIPTPGNGLKETIIQRASSIAEGQEVDAKQVSTITLNYNTVVNINQEARVTLNGERVTPQRNATTAMSIDIPVSLEPGMSYTLEVPSGTVVDKNDQRATAKAYTLRFTTKKSGEQNLPDNGAMAMTKALGFGWNLGNHFDSHNNGRPVSADMKHWWDNATPTEALYQTLAAQGVQTVRIPVTWGPWEGEAPQYTINANFMALVKQNVEWAREAGLKVVLNTHHDEYWMDAYAAGGNTAVNDSLKQRIAATWRQIAETFKQEGDYLILETFNELNHEWKDATQREIEIQNEWNQLAVDVIRSTGANNATRWIAVPSYQASPKCALRNDFALPNDPAGKLIVAIHCYDPYDFTLRDPLKTTWGTDADRKAITDVLNKVKEKFIDQDIPCYLGEFGCSLHVTEAENAIRATYLEYFCRAAHFAGLAACLWDNHNPGQGPEHHAFFSHNNGAWMDGQEPIVKKMIKALTSTDANYTLESIR